MEFVLKRSPMSFVPLLSMALSPKSRDVIVVFFFRASTRTVRPSKVMLFPLKSENETG